jgi:hypothetical protein
MKRRLIALGLAVVSALVAVFALALAFDAHRWRTELADDDVGFRTSPSAPRLWTTETVLPGDPAARLLAVHDDVRYRGALRTFYVARLRRASAGDPEIEAARGEAQVELVELSRTDSYARRRAEEYNLLGVLALAGARSIDRSARVGTLLEAVGYFRDAVRLDRANEDAAFNLETAMRRLRDEPRSFQERGGRRPRDNATSAGLRTPGSGY